MKHILKFTSEVRAYCERQGISPLSLSVRVLKSSYALDRIERMSSRLGESMTKLQAEMDKVEPKRLTPPPIVICYVLSVPTSTNRLFIGKGKRKTADYTDWIATAGGEILAQRPKMPIKALPSGPYAVTVEIPETDPGDIDNRMKAVLDLLVRMQITPDDRWLWVQGSRRSRTIPSGQIRVVIRTVEPDLEALVI